MVSGSGPGASGWSNFKGNYPFLAEHGYRTIVPDTMGYGYSTKPAEGTFSLSDVADQYKGLLDAIGIERATVVGNSQGGAIAIAMALDYPEVVEKLVLMAPGALESRDGWPEVERTVAVLEVYAVRPAALRRGCGRRDATAPDRGTPGRRDRRRRRQGREAQGPDLRHRLARRRQWRSCGPTCTLAVPRRDGAGMELVTRARISGVCPSPPY